MSSDLRDSVPGEYSRSVRLAHCAGNRNGVSDGKKGHNLPKLPIKLNINYLQNVAIQLSRTSIHELDESGGYFPRINLAT